ncbi:hypothetical protein HDV00_009321, partial [Rhizophlyctis rosea]
KRLQAMHFRSTPASRKHLLDQCWDALSASANVSEDSVELLAFMRRTFGRWFLGAGFDDIYRGNWEIWAAWVFFDHELHLMSEAEREEVSDLVNDLEQRMGCQFKTGCNPNVSCIRLTVDPVRIAYRPLAYYGGTMAIHFFGKKELERLGFRSRTVKTAGQKPETVLYRPALTPSPAGSMPIVFIHVLELVMNYFVSQEMGIAYSLSRHFHWSRNVLFVEDLPRKGRNVIILAEEDVIVPAKAVERYLLTKGEEMRKRTGVRNCWNEESGDDLPRFLDLVHLKGCQHGELMIRQDLLHMVSNKIALASGVVPVQAWKKKLT